MNAGERREMAISESELKSMTRELDMLHNETFPTARTTIEDFAANMAHLRSAETTRRNVLFGMGGAVVLGALTACSSSGGKSGSSSSGPSVTDSNGSVHTSPYSGDLRVVALAAALENLAVTAYGSALSAASKGKLGKVPPAVASFVQTAMAQHKDHAAAWNGVLTSAKLPAITGAPLTITKGAVASLGKVKDVPGVAKLALGLEQAAADTYTFAAANVSDAGGIMTAATIQPVETMHAAILSFVLGEYPVPISFIGTDKAVKPDALTA